MKAGWFGVGGEWSLLPEEFFIGSLKKQNILYKMNQKYFGSSLKELKMVLKLKYLGVQYKAKVIGEYLDAVKNWCQPSKKGWPKWNRSM